jgi:hypothetical protein
MAVQTGSETWQAVKAAAEAGVRQAQENLERPGTGITETERERGYIKAMREILALASPAAPKPEFRSDEPVPY